MTGIVRFYRISSAFVSTECDFFRVVTLGWEGRLGFLKVIELTLTGSVVTILVVAETGNAIAGGEIVGYGWNCTANIRRCIALNIVYQAMFLSYYL